MGGGLMALGPERRGKVLDRERRDRKEITLAGEKKNASRQQGRQGFEK